jgi:hypothetical protein
MQPAYITFQRPQRLHAPGRAAVQTPISRTAPKTAPHALRGRGADHKRNGTVGQDKVAPALGPPPCRSKVSDKGGGKQSLQRVSMLIPDVRSLSSSSVSSDCCPLEVDFRRDVVTRPGSHPVMRRVVDSQGKGNQGCTEQAFPTVTSGGAVHYQDFERRRDVGLGKQWIALSAGLADAYRYLSP